MWLMKMGGAFVPWTDEAQQDAKRYAQGEVIEVQHFQIQNPQRHRKVFKMLQVAFGLWQEQSDRKRRRGETIPTMNFNAFRKNVTILAGYRTEWIDFEGKMHIDAQSLSYEKMSDKALRKYESDLIDTLLASVLDGCDEVQLRAILDFDSGAPSAEDT